VFVNSTLKLKSNQFVPLNVLAPIILSQVSHFFY